MAVPKYAIYYWLKTGWMWCTTVSANPYIEADIINRRAPLGQGILFVDMIEDEWGMHHAGKRWRIHHEDARHHLVAKETGFPVRDANFGRCCEIDPSSKRVSDVFLAHGNLWDGATIGYLFNGREHIIHHFAAHGDRWDGQQFYRRWVKEHNDSCRIVEEIELPLGIEPALVIDHSHFCTYNLKVGDFVLHSRAR